MGDYPQCLITGCYATDGESYVYGDLHQVGRCFIMNTILYGGEAHREWDAVIPQGARVLHFDPRQAFERRGVIVIPKASADLNKTAQLYLEKSHVEYR